MGYHIFTINYTNLSLTISLVFFIWNISLRNIEIYFPNDGIWFGILKCQYGEFVIILIVENTDLDYPTKLTLLPYVMYELTLIGIYA